MKQRITTLATLLALMTVTFGAGYLAGNNDNTPAAAQDAGTEELFEPFWEAWDLMHEFYVDPLDDTELMEGALVGMMAVPGDPNTDYMTPERYSRAREGLTGEYEGIGATVRKDEETGALTIIRPMPGSPAEAAGILPGDQVVTVNGENVTDLELEVIISMVKGPANTDVTLGILRGEENLELVVTRARIALPSVEHEVFDNNIGYVLLYNFGLSSASELAQTLDEMDAENLNGLILDVRGNNGGYLDVTLEIISMFISRGTIFIERGANGTEDKVQAFGNPLAPTVPMVLLTDGFSASASELLAGALQDHERATLIGTSTYGKGSVQTWRQLSNGGGIRITISRWFTPAGRSVEPDGINPDIEVEYIIPEEGALYDRANDNQIQAALEYLESVGGPSGPQAGIPATTPIAFS